MPFFSMKKLVNIEDNIKIGTTGSRDLTGDLFCPPKGEANGSGIVIIHGGGWREGDKNQLRGYGILLAREGLPASQLLIDYLKKRFGLHRYKM